MYTVCEMDHPYQGGRGWAVIMDTGDARWFATSLREALKTALFLNVRMAGEHTFTMHDADRLIALGYDHEQGVTVCQSIPGKPTPAKARQGLRRVDLV
jgi:hypothetical protein